MTSNNQTLFSELSLTPAIRRAVEAMGFETATDIQAQSIPLIQSGCDVIGRSQTGTGKTVAFGIPALEAIDTTSELRHAVQVLILCPTRELAVQACEEIRKLAQFMPGVRAVDVYGGAPMDRQILRLKTANIVVGTPGRVMDHMRRKTLRLDALKMIVLDEADEMLSMGFREDIETILAETPEQRQTVLFSATMPPAILALTRTYQKNPQLVQIAQTQETVENIEQTYCDVPMGRKMDALALLLQYEAPKLALIFCNTKRMVDEITEYLGQHDFLAEGLHGDMKQSQRTKVMSGFKHGRTGILVATDVAARGIDVNDIDYVINYDVPQSAEYYVHRIGRTGRAGKSGKALTICSGRRQVGELMQIAHDTKTPIARREIPKPQEIRFKQQQIMISAIEDAAAAENELPYLTAAEELVQRGLDPVRVAAAVMGLHWGEPETDIAEIPDAPVFSGAPRASSGRAGGRYQKIVINIGRQKRVAPNHIVGAITERTGLSGREIGKIEIYDDETVVSVPEKGLDETLAAMENLKILGNPTVTKLYKGGESSGRSGGSYAGSFHGGPKDYRRLPKKSEGERRRSKHHRG